MGRRGDTWHNSSLTLASRSISTYINSPDMLYVCIYSTFYTVAAARLGELCSGDIDITTPRLQAQNTNQLLRCAAGVFFSPESVQNEWRSYTRPSEEKSVRVTMGIYHAGGIWPRLVFIYSEGKKPCVYFIQFWKYDIRSYRRKRPCLVSSTTCARPQLKPSFKNIFINLLPRLYIIILGPPVATLQCTPLTWQLYLHLYMSVSFRDIDPIESRGSSRGFNR